MTQVEKEWKDWLLEQKAESVEFFDLEGASDVVDEVLVATALNTRHLAHLAEDAMRHAKELKMGMIAADGLDGREWVVLDFGTYMLHFMLPEVRERINIEEHLRDLKRSELR